MTIPIDILLRAHFNETGLSVVGSVVHELLYTAKNPPMHQCWSQPVSVANGGPIVFDTTQLSYPNSTIVRDLLTNQELRWVSAQHRSGAVGSIIFKNGADVLISATLGTNGLYIMRNGAGGGHVLGQPVTSIECWALLGPFEVDLILATHAV